MVLASATWWALGDGFSLCHLVGEKGIFQLVIAICTRQIDRQIERGTEQNK
jgi:hypothetical protein